jgi:polyisoprenoid-binding protein YceI
MEQTAAISNPKISSPKTWNIDPSHTTAGFAVRHLMVSTVRGHFSKVSGTVRIDDRDVTRSQIDVAIEAGSIESRDENRDAHLRSPDFLDVEKFPTLTFRSTQIAHGRDGELLVTGDLTIRGVTRPVTLAVDSLTPPTRTPWGTTVRGVSATGKLNRKDFGLTWNTLLEAGGVAVGDEVKLTIDAELVEQKPAQNS